MIASKDIKNFPIFSLFNKAELEEIVQLTTVTSLDRGQELFKKGAKRESFYIILEGEIAIVRHFGHTSQIVEIATAGEYIAEYALFDPRQTHDHTALSHTTHSSILELKGEQFKKLALETRYKLLLNLLPIISDNFSHASNRLMALFYLGQTLGTLMQNTRLMGTHILKIVLDAIRAKKAFIAMNEPDSAKIHIIATFNFGPKNDIAGKTFLIENEPILYPIIKNKKHLVLSTKDYLMSNKKVPYITSSVIGLPLPIGEDIIGAIVLIDKIEGNGFSANNEVLLNIIAHMVALGLHHAKEREIQLAEQELKHKYISL